MFSPLLKQMVKSHTVEATCDDWPCRCDHPLVFLGSLGLLRDITGANLKVSARKTWVFTLVFTSLTKFAGSKGSFSV